MKRYRENNTISSLLIAACLIPQVLGLVLGSGFDNQLLFKTSSFFLLLLVGYFVYCNISDVFIYTLGFFVLAIALDVYSSQENVLHSARIGVRALFGVWMLWYTLKQYLKSKDVELITFLSALFLVLNSSLYLSIAEDDNIKMIVLFGSTFTLATVIYYENLWDQHSEVAKKWIIICLISLLLDVFQISKHLISF